MSISLGYSWSTRSFRHVLAGTCVHAHIWAVCTWLSLSPECFCCMCVGSQALCGRLLLNLVPRVPWMSFSTGLFPSSPDILIGLSVCLSACHSCHAACIQRPEPVAYVPSSPALALWKGQNVWVTTPLMPPHTRSCVPLWSLPDPFPDLFPY